MTAEADTPPPFAYDAFLSYRRSDGRRAATWLRRRLLRFHMPPSLRAYERPLRIFQDTAYERAAQDFYEDNILPSLRGAKHLIVLGTGMANQSLPDGRPNWVEREVEDFCADAYARPVIPVLVDELTTLPARLAERFPNIEVIDLRALRGLRRFSFRARGQLADEVVKVVGLLQGLPIDRMPELRQEEERARAGRTMRLALGALMLAVVFLFVAGWAVFEQQSASRQLVLNLVARARLLHTSAPLEAQTYLARAVATADASWASRLGRGDDSGEVARLWLGALSRMPPALILFHPGPVASAEFSRDGRLVVTADSDGAARLWNAQTGESIGQPMQHAKALTHARFDPEGRRVATASWDGTARVWDASTGSPITGPLRHAEVVMSVAFDGAGQRLVTAGWDEMVRVWDVATGTLLPGFAPIHCKYFCNEAWFDPKTGSLLVSAEWGSRATIWDAASGTPIRDEPFLHEDSVNEARFSPDGLRLATASSDGTARVWNVLSGNAIGPPLRHERQVRAVAFSPDSDLVATGSADGTARIWEAEGGGAVGRPLVHEGEVNDVAFSADGARLATASSDRTARVWNTRSGAPLGRVFDHQGAVKSVAFDATGEHLLTASDDGTARIWSMAEDDLALELRDSENPQSPVSAAAFSPDGRWLVTGNNHGAVLVADLAGDATDGKWIRFEAHVVAAQFGAGGKRLMVATDTKLAVWRTGAWSAPEQELVSTEPIFSAAISPDGRLLASGHGDGAVQIWSADSGERIGDPLVSEAAPPDPGETPDRAIKSLAFSADSKRLASACEDGVAVLWNVADRTRIGAPMRHDKAVNQVAFSPRDDRIATAGVDHVVRLWNAHTAEPIGIALKHNESINHIAFDSDGARIVTASDDTTAQLWDARDGHPIGPRLRHSGAVWWAEFSSDGRRVATSIQGGSAQVWDALTGDPIGAPLLHEQTITQATFDPTGERLVTAGYDGRARVWWVGPDRSPAAEIVRRTERATGLRLDDATGGVRMLSEAEWRELGTIR